MFKLLEKKRPKNNEDKVLEDGEIAETAEVKEKTDREKELSLSAIKSRTSRILKSRKKIEQKYDVFFTLVKETFKIYLQTSEELTYAEIKERIRGNPSKNSEEIIKFLDLISEAAYTPVEHTNEGLSELAKKFKELLV